VIWNSIHESPILSWSLHCQSNTTITRAILGNDASTLGQCPWRPCRSTLSGWGHTTSPIKAFRTFGGPLKPSRTILSLYQEVGPSRHFFLAVGARNPQQLHTSMTSTCDLWCSHITNLLSSSSHVDVDGHLTCLIEASIEEVMPLETFAISGATSRPLLF
jgi:hypothetical protein